MTKPKKYKVTDHSHYFTRGETVYELLDDDKNYAKLDSDELGTEYVSVTAYADGQYPFATIEKRKLKLVEQVMAPVKCFLVISVTNRGINLLGLYETIEAAKERALDGAKLTAENHFVMECKTLSKFEVSTREIFYDQD